MKLRVLLAATAVMIPSTLYAQQNDDGFSYTYVDLAFIHNNFNSDDVTLSNDNLNATIGESTGNGGSLKVSFELLNKEKIGLYVAGEYYQTSHKSGIGFTGSTIANGTISVRQKEFRLGAGTFFHLHEKIDIYGEISYLKQKNTLNDFVVDTGQQGDLTSVSFSGSNIDLRLGFRAKLTDSFEVNGYVRRHPFGKVDQTSTAILNFKNQYKANFGVRWYALKNVSIGADYEFGKPGHLRLGARIEF